VYVFSIEAPTPLPKRTTPKRTTPTGKTPTGKTPTGKTPTGKTPKNGKPKNGTSKRPLTTQGPDARLPLTAQTPTAKRPTSQSRLPKPTRPLSIEDLLLAPPNPRQLVAPNVSTRTGTRPKVGSQPIEAPTPLTAWLPDPVEPNQKPPAPTTIRRPTKRRAKFPFVEPTGGSELPQFGLVLSPQVVAQVKPKRRERLGPTPFGVRTRKPKKSGVPVVPFGDSELMRALRTDNRGLDTNNVAAAKLRVYLPPRKLGAQAVTIKSDTLAVRGETDPQNEITVNGRKAKVRKDGKFSIVVPIPWGKSKITIVSKDKMGNQAQIVWPVERAKFSWFLLAMAEGVLGQKGAKLDGMNQHTKVDLGPVYLHGKSAVYFKAWIKGSKLFKEYFITAHMDTSKLSEFEEFFKETINPEKYYPVFGDSSTLKQDAVSRGKFYVLLQADQSKLTLGNFRTAIKGIELLNYDRPFYGVMVDFKKTFAKNYKTELKTFVSWDNRQYKRGYNLFRGTGGSIYYLRHTELLDGSEKVKLVVRDRDNGTVLMEIPQSRNTDYTIRYSEGRIYLKSPVPSVVDASFLSTGYLGSRNQIDGHPVYLEVSYEYQGTEKDGDVSFGAHVKQTFFNMFTIGGGYIQEGRKGSNTPTYRLYGGELTFHYKKKTKVTAELTRSHSSDAFNMLSEDGGLTFKDINLTGSGSTKGWAYKFTGEIELGEYFGKKKDWIFIKGFYSRSQPGFYSYGTILEQGSEKFGGEVRWHITARDMLTVRHDGVITQAPDPTFEGGFRSYEKELSTLQYKHQRKIWQLVAEYNHIFTKDSRDPKGINGDTLAIAGTYKILKWLDLSLQQEFVIHGDSRILTRTLDHFKTTVGVGFQIAPSVKVTIAEELRWSGENTTVVGFRTKLDDKSEFYVEERMKSQRDTKGWLTTTVIGAQQKMGKDGKTRSYGEYQLDTGIAGLTNRAVMGFGRRFTIIKGLNLEGLYERSQTFGGIVGNTSRDAFSVSLEILRWEFLKAATKFEVRYDNGDNKVEGSHDKIQYITMNTINAKVHEDVTLFGRFNYSQTGNITLDIREAELMEATFGLAYRPVKHDWVNLLIKYTHLLEMRPLNLIENSIERTSQDVVSLELVFELPFHLQLAEKIAFKRMVEQIDALASIESMTLLWINRLSYHLYRPKKIFGGVDVAVEYRQLHQFLARDFQHGVLLEVAVLVTKFAKIGVGWNFTKFTDNEFSKYDKNESGFFFRVVGRF
ncbi:MAG: hypothetical protein KC609_12535, partial [Myxococcales bacterium]|nr:hypothetical protein [Myxococcales bacterium]